MRKLALFAALAALVIAVPLSFGSSHREAPLTSIDPTGDDEVRKSDEAPNSQEDSLENTDWPATEHGSVPPIVDDIAFWRPCRGVRHKLELFIEVRCHQIQHESGNATFGRRHRPHEKDARSLVVRGFCAAPSPSPRAAEVIQPTLLRHRSDEVRSTGMPAHD